MVHYLWWQNGACDLLCSVLRLCSIIFCLQLVHDSQAVFDHTHVLNSWHTYIHTYVHLYLIYLIYLIHLLFLIDNLNYFLLFSFVLQSSCRFFAVRLCLPYSAAVRGVFRMHSRLVAASFFIALSGFPAGNLSARPTAYSEHHQNSTT